MAGPSHGTLGTVDGSGWVTYTPAPGFEGTDSFTYRGVYDGETGPPATVTLNVAAPPAEGGEAPPPALQETPPPPPPPPPGPGGPPADPNELAAEQRLGGDAVKAPDLTLGATKAFVPAGAAGGVVTVDAASEKLLALVCPTACDISAAQQLDLGGATARAAARKKPIKLRTQKLKLKAGQAGVVVLRLTKAQRRKLKRAKRATLKVAITVKDARGKTVRDTARYRLRGR